MKGISKILMGRWISREKKFQAVLRIILCDKEMDGTVRIGRSERRSAFWTGSPASAWMSNPFPESEQRRITASGAVFQQPVKDGSARSIPGMMSSAPQSGRLAVEPNQMLMAADQFGQLPVAAGGIQPCVPGKRLDPFQRLFQKHRRPGPDRPHGRMVALERKIDWICWDLCRGRHGLMRRISGKGFFTAVAE